MNFKELSTKIAENLESMSTGFLFRSKVTGDELWDIYINSFMPGDDPIFRDPNSTTHTCNLDRNFIRRYGNIISIDNENNIKSIFEVSVPVTSKYYASINKMLEVIYENPVGGVFVETYDSLRSLPYESTNAYQSKFRLGIPENHKKYTQEEVDRYGVVNTKDIYTFNHFYGYIDRARVSFTGESIESIVSKYNSGYAALNSGLTLISISTLELVRELIEQDSILNGKSYLTRIERFIELKKEYINLKDNHSNWMWKVSSVNPDSRFKNSLIGVLCTEIESGYDLNDAVLNWNKRVDPANYMKAKAPISSLQIKEAKKFVEENGYEPSFTRRLAMIADINLSEIFHVNSANPESIPVSVFDNLGVKGNQIKFNPDNRKNLPSIGIAQFMSEIIPSSTEVQILLENRLTNNLVALTTSLDRQSKKIFKWDNNFAWTYFGNLAGKSLITETVKKAGGKLDGVMRFSILWNEDGKSIVDLDAHAHEPGDTHIYFGRKTSFSTGATLDVDMINPESLGVENIVWTNKNTMKKGTYSLSINNYNSRHNNGFKAEVMIEGTLYTYESTEPLYHTVKIADVTLDQMGNFSIEHKLPVKESTKSVWNVNTNEFHKVTLACLSPNYWNDNSAGNKHFMFMLKDCKPTEKIRGFHNEYLNSDLHAHRKVIDIVAEYTKIDPAECTESLSGLGFNATVRESFITRVTLRSGESKIYNVNV